MFVFVVNLSKEKASHDLIKWTRSTKPLTAVVQRGMRMRRMQDDKREKVGSRSDILAFRKWSADTLFIIA